MGVTGRAEVQQDSSGLDTTSVVVGVRVLVPLVLLRNRDAAARSALADQVAGYVAALAREQIASWEEEGTSGAG
jgi:hypothetical protein